MKLRLQAKYTLMLGGVALGVSLALTVMFAVLTERTAEDLNKASIIAAHEARERQTETRGRDIANMLSAALGHHIETAAATGDDETVSRLAREALSLRDVAMVRIYDSTGTVIRDGTPTGESLGAIAPPAVKETVLGRKDWLVERDGNNTRVSAPVLRDGRLVGAVSVQLSHSGFKTELAGRRTMLDQIADESYNHVIGYITLFLVIIILTAIIIGTFAARRMSQPIEQLRGAVSRIANGQFEIVWPQPRDDEIGELADGLKKMVLQLRTKTVSMTYLDDIISSMFDCLVVTDSRQRIEKVNVATCRLTGYSAHDLINQPFTKLLMPPGSLVMLPLEQDFELSAVGLMVDTIYAKSGKAIPVQMGVTVMASHVDGKPRMVSMFRDVSEQRAREEELRQAKEEAEIANASKSQFLANMSHELRTPLNAVIGFSSMIKDEIKGPLSDTYKSYAGDIHDSAQHLLAIINDILDISKLEAGKMEIYDEDVGVAEIVLSTIRLVKTKADERQITLEVDIPADLPDICVDQRMLKQILINLLSNAVKFNRPSGKVSVVARLCLDGALAIAVTDTGIGMDPANIPRLLEPFSQGDSALNRNYEGTGLGLAITKSMTELHGGRLTVESAVDQGTTITITLPPERVMLRDPMRARNG